jgi:hypothetical protein
LLNVSFSAAGRRLRSVIVAGLDDKRRAGDVGGGRQRVSSWCDWLGTSIDG